MELTKILTPEVVTADLKGETKAEIIESLIDLLVAAGKISDKASARACIMDREAKMSTGMEFGIAIPHGKCGAVNELVGCVGIKKDGVDFKALDRKPSRIFILTVSPLERTGPHVQFLAEISRLLREPDIRKSLIEASTPEEIISIITG